mgnify:CR=1 FL=1
MKNNLVKISETEKKFLSALMENGSKTDSQIAREIKVSKATAHRTRKKLEEEGILIDYIPIVNLDKIGIRFFAIVMFEWNKFDDKEQTQKMLNSLEKDPHVVYLASGDSSNGLSHTMMVAFPDLSGYHSYMKKFRGKYKNYVDRINSFFIPSEKILKQDYTDLVKYILEKSR